MQSFVTLSLRRRDGCFDSTACETWHDVHSTRPSTSRSFSIVEPKPLGVLADFSFDSAKRETML